jgi:hypothetical protein
MGDHTLQPGWAGYTMNGHGPGIGESHVSSETGGLQGRDMHRDSGSITVGHPAMGGGGGKQPNFLQKLYE